MLFNNGFYFLSTIIKSSLFKIRKLLSSLLGIG